MDFSEGETSFWSVVERKKGIVVFILCLGAVTSLITPFVVDYVNRYCSLGKSSQALFETEGEGTGLKVEISGGVERPGVYEIPYGSRISDLLALASGLSGDADTLYVACWAKDQFSREAGG